MEEKIASIRGENWTFTLYPENTQDMTILDYITKNYKYAYITHDKDEETDIETGEIKTKKEHIHVIMILENARTLKSVSEELKLEPNRIEKIKSIRFMFRYLLHLDQPTKSQYDKEEIRTNLKELVDKYCKTNIEPNQIAQLLEYIYTFKRHVYYHEILKYAINNNLYASYRRGTNIMIKIIDEHNQYYKGDKKYGS